MYQSYYNLTGKPFRLSPDPAFFFPSRGHKRALAYLRYGLNQDEGFVVITGAPGTGKTTLAKILLQEMDSSVVVAHLTTTQLEADDMLRMVAASFGLRYEGLDKAGLLKSLEHFLLARSRERKRALLVIDEAQNLPSRSLEELRMLSNLQVGDKALLQIFLLGQEQFRNMLDDPMLEQLRQRVIANFHLTPLAADECQRYVESRLHHVGWNKDPNFAEVAHELIHQFSDGIPRRINMLCDRILLFGCMEETHEITGEVVNLVKKELDEEISGKAVDPSETEYSGPSEKFIPAKISEPNPAAYQPAKLKSVQPEMDKSEPAPINPITVPAKPEPFPQVSAKKEPPIQTAQKPATPQAISKSDLENSGLSHTASAFDDSELNDDIEDLDIDYAMFEDKKQDKEAKETAPAKVETAHARKESVFTQIKESVDAEIKKINNENPPKQLKEKISVMEEKFVNKDRQESAKKKPSQPTPASGGKQVMGNTVQKTKPETVKTDTEEAAKHSEIIERDLFRVIPGGKSFGKIPGLNETNDAAIAASAKSEPSSSDVRLRRILRLVLAFHRSPSRFPGLDTPAQPLPEGITELLELAISDDQVLNQVSPAAVMGISPVMLRAAVRFFVRRALFTPEGDHYRTLGLHPGASLTQIEKHYDLLMRLLRQDKQRGSADSVERVGQAYEALSRGEHSPTAGNKPTVQETKPVFEEEPISGVGGDKDTSNLIIDFDEVEKNPPKPLPSTFVAKPNERFNPAASGKVSRKTVRYASQLAVLGFGALVIVLGLYIVQLDPSNAPAQNPVAIAPSSDAVVGDRAEENAAEVDAAQNNIQIAQYASVSDATDADRQRGLLFSDGSTDPLTAKRPSDLTSAINAEAESTLALDQRSASDHDEIETMRRELLAKSEAADTVEEAVPNHESPLVSNMDFDPEATPSPRSESNLSSQSSVPAPTNTAPIAATAGSSAVMATMASAPAAADPSAGSDVSKPPANRFEGKDIEIADSQPQKAESFASIAARTQIPKASTPAAAAPSADSASAQIAAAPPQAAVENPMLSSKAKINETELLDLVDNFLAYYQAGNVKEIMSLFASDARTNNRTNALGIQADYNELFKSTALRKMTISSLNWSVENDYARGIGDYQAQINPVGTQGSQTFSGNITIQVQKGGDGLKITRFYFSNQSVSTGPRMTEGNAGKTTALAAPAVAVVAAPPASKQSTVEQTADITAQDLQNLVSDFAQTYANGDIDGLMSLFTDNAKTNDQTSAKGIRKDYVDLFQGTTTRQMVINNMKWTLNDQQATGQGPFEVKVQSKGNNSTTTVKGTLRMQVVKNGGRSQITEMIHAIE